MIKQKHKRYNLEKDIIPVYDHAKSFYKKAQVKTYYCNELVCKYELYSYETLVCTIENGKYYLNHNVPEYLLLSNTTKRHIKEFLLQHMYMLSNEIRENGIYGKKDLLKYEGM